MLDEKDLQAIDQLIQKRIGESEKRMIAESTHNMKVLLDTEVQTKFNLLAENQQIMMEKLERLDDMEIVDTRLSALEAIVKKLNREVNQLKKAN